MALMVLWVEAMGRGEWVGGIDGERIFFYIPAHLPWGCIQNCEGKGSGGIDGIVGGSHGRGEGGWVGWREREREELIFFF